jgi:peptidoglycan/xylan/chitin deacetylase (PgdA/CDA1 family)
LLSRVSGSPGAIVCFHGVHAERWPSASPLHVTAAAFAATMDALASIGRVVPLAELLGRYRDGRSTRGLIAVTFDDAYASLEVIIPLIRQRGLPVTLFPVSGALAGSTRFWWDRLDDLAARIGTARWREVASQCGAQEPLREWVLGTHTGRLPPRLDAAFTTLEQETGGPTSQRSMTVTELRDLCSLPEVSIGVHTRTHPVLPLLSDVELRSEIQGCYEDLRAILPTVTPVLAAPYGLFDARTVVAARDAGMSATLTLQGTVLRPRRDDAGIPRFCVLRHDRPAMLGFKMTSLGDRLNRWRGHPADAFPAIPNRIS